MFDAASENDIYSTLIEAIPKILNWLRYFKATEVLELFLHSLCVTLKVLVQVIVIYWTIQISHFVFLTSYVSAIAISCYKTHFTLLYKYLAWNKFQVAHTNS